MYIFEKVGYKIRNYQKKKVKNILGRPFTILFDFNALGPTMQKHCKRITREVSVKFPQIPEHHERMTSAFFYKKNYKNLHSVYKAG